MSALRKSPEGFFVLYTALRPNHIRSMVTDSYTQSKPLNQIIAEGYGEVIPTLLRRQAAIADRYYLRRMLRIWPMFSCVAISMKSSPMLIVSGSKSTIRIRSGS